MAASATRKSTMFILRELGRGSQEPLPVLLIYPA
jgi:hypothetical protein